jgi:sugar phosphate isomerase/epimerase
VVETGARYLINPRLKHDPTLMDPDPARRAVRVDFLERSIDLACLLEADAVSFWSGRLPDDVSDDEAMGRLVEALKPVLDRAEARNMPLAFEPEPGMFIATVEQFSLLDQRVRHPLFHMTLDLGHVHCNGEGDPGAMIRRWADRILNIHIEDMVEGVHEHLPFGEGTMDFGPIFDALREIHYPHGVHVELSRESHRGAEMVRRAFAFLQPYLQRGSSAID